MTDMGMFAPRYQRAGGAVRGSRRLESMTPLYTVGTAQSVFLVFPRWPEFWPTGNWHPSDAAGLRRGQKAPTEPRQGLGALWRAGTHFREWQWRGAARK